LYSQENRTYKINSKEEELDNKLVFSEGNKQKELLKYAFCKLEMEGLVDSIGFKLSLTQLGLMSFE
jgi:hypothetical protein